MEFERAICWLRRDLRLHDHTALAEATKRACKVTVVFVFDRHLLSNLADRDDRRVTFISESLRELDERLREKGSALLVAYGDPVHELVRLAKETKAEAVFANEDYEPFAKRRDEAVGTALRELGTALYTYTDQVIFPGRAFTNQAGNPYRIFTPYKEAWLKRLSQEDYAERKPRLAHLTPLSELRNIITPWDLSVLGFKRATLWLSPGEEAAGAKLRSFAQHLARYEQDRNFPGKKGTSGLSAHLRFGTLSIRACVRLARASRSAGGAAWLSELVWRDFFHMILDRFPHVASASFRPEYQDLPWPGSREDFSRWCQGETGFPIVDAAMRELNATGWMHNRLRMIVASFLVKDLLCDWKWGESYFARRLLDYDLAANNGGWQWSASTGCDAQPYFRIFNPVSQSQKFDPVGTYIRAQLPKLRPLSDKAIHEPTAYPRELAQTGIRLGEDYPAPMVDHDEQRFKVLALFEAARKSHKT